MISDELLQSLSSRYRIEGELGRGGMATVFLAEDSRHNRKVAIKVLKPEVVAALGHDRFRREIEIAARLQHPNILPLFDSGEVSGQHYYIMPFVQGESLRARLQREGRLPLDAALRIAAQVADALSYAHDCGVVHRDIKPENILLEHGNAFIMDFGIAATTAAPGAARMTQAGSMIGTPAYMSPEQSMGGEELDGRSDVYSLACVLFEMLAGTAPFSGTMESILVQRFTEPPPRLSSVAEGLPVWLDAALFRAMARNAEERFPSARHFLDAISHKSSPGAEAASSTSIAVLPFLNMSPSAEDEYFSDGVAEEIINALSHVPGLHVAARTSAFSFKGKREDLRIIGEKLNVGTVLEGSVRRVGNRLRITVQLVNAGDGYQLWSERYDRDLTDVFEIQDEIANSIAAKFKMTATAAPGKAVRRGTSNLDAYEVFLKGRALQYKRGQTVTQAIGCFEQAVALDPNYAEAMAWMSDSYRLMGTYGLRAPELTMPQAKHIAQRALSLDPNLDEAYATLADVSLVYDRNEAEAFRHWERALTLNPSNVRARCEYAFWGLSCLRGASEEALTQVGMAAEADPLNAWPASMQALVLGAAGRYQDALGQATRACELDPDSFVARWLLIQALSWIGDYQRAISTAKTSLSTTGRHPWVLGALAAAYGLARQNDAADAILDELKARARLEYVQPTWIVFAAIGAGRLDEAMALAERGVDEHDPTIITAWGHPSWAPLRAHPRFGGLRQRMGFVNS